MRVILLIMANAVDKMVTSCLVMSHDGKKEQISIQNRYLSFTVIVDMLKEDNLNGLHRQTQKDSRFTHEVINKPEFKDALCKLKDTIRHWKDKQEAEMDSMVGALNTTDTHLCSSYHTVANHLMADEINFGRIGSMFFFTYVLSKRLHRQGRQREIESVVDWLAVFLDEKITPWLLRNHNGQWVCLLGSDREVPCQSYGMSLNCSIYCLLGKGFISSRL